MVFSSTNKALPGLRAFVATVALGLGVGVSGAAASPGPARGDINGDGSFNVMDVNCLVLAILNPSTPPTCLANEVVGDVNCDAASNIIDVGNVVHLSMAGLPPANDVDGNAVHDTCDALDLEATSGIGVSCESCSLKLERVITSSVGGEVTGVEIDIIHQPFSEDPLYLPRLSDLRVHVNQNVTLVEAVRGAALVEAGKVLFVDPVSGDPWKVLPASTGEKNYQFLLYSLASNQRIGSGSLLRLRFTMQVSEPVEFNLVKRSGTFSPLEADQALNSQSNNYDAALVIDHE